LAAGRQRLTSQNLREGTFAGTIASDESNSVAMIDANCDIFY
jgi:hypothetical protein